MKAIILGLCIAIQLFGGSYDEALQKAKQEQKKVLVELVMEFCPFCERMKKYVLSDETVKSFMDRYFVFVELDIDKEPIPEHLTSRLTPTFYMLSPSGVILHEIKGAPGKKEFLEHLNYAVSLESVQ